MRSLRHWTWWSVLGAGAMVVLVTTMDLAQGRYGVVGTVLLGLAVAIVIAQHARYLRLAMDGLGRGGHRGWEHLATFAVALAALAYASAHNPTPIPWYLLPAAVVAHVVTALPDKRWPVAVVGTAATVAAGGFLRTPDPVEAIVVPVLLVTVFIFAYIAQLWVWDAVLKIERARETASALAIAEERLRFAADLHDIQGHHLQAIALKGELIERLIGRDDATARKHAAEVATLARTALRETRDVVRGYRRAGLGTEITNAVGLLRAAGIETAVDGDASDVPPPLQPLFGALVREGTTNVLRHSRATRCALQIHVHQGQVAVRLSNDGAQPDDNDHGAGLAGLRERFATVGGRVEVHNEGSDFELRGHAGVRL